MKRDHYINFNKLSKGPKVVNRSISELRSHMNVVCNDGLNPDLIILDRFHLTTTYNSKL